MDASFTQDCWHSYAALSRRRSDPETAKKTRSDFCTSLGQLLLADTFGLDPRTGRAIAGCLYERMSDENLHYHTPLHVLSMLAFAQAHASALDPWHQLALWFHDALYTPAAEAGENEHSSAMFMHALLHPWVPDEILSQAEAAVEATAMHQLPDVDPAFHLILDLDLCSFAWDRPNYLAASENLAQEFIPVYGQESFQVGRKRFLAEILAKGYVYRTGFFRASFEAQARANVEQDLLELARVRLSVNESQA